MYTVDLYLKYVHISAFSNTIIIMSPWINILWITYNIQTDTIFFFNDAICISAINSI